MLFLIFKADFVVYIYTLCAVCFGLPGRPTFGSRTGEKNLSSRKLPTVGYNLGDKLSTATIPQKL